ncbi:MAG: T9SS type A sorting domain-containing protein [Bacteroidetes bacterium]|nr:T9SS type A sorting domain-containing protein [Bacteroidota bacterium]
MQKKPDLRDYIFLFGLLFSFGLEAQDTTTAWMRNYGGNKADQFSTSVLATKDSGYIFLNSTNGTDSNVASIYGSGDDDLWVVKTDKKGIIEWEKNYGCSVDDLPANILLTQDSCYLISGTVDKNDSDVTISKGGYDIWLAKIDRNGKLLWEKSYGGSDIEQIFKIINTPFDSGYIFTGYTLSNNKDVKSNKGGGDIWVVKLDKNGKILWQKTYGGSDYDEPNDIIQTPEDGGYLVCGRTRSADGDIKANIGDDDGFILKLDKKGGVIWEKNYGSNEADVLEAIIRMPDTSYILTGYKKYSFTLTSGDLWVLKIKNKSTVVFDRKFGGSNSEGAHCIVATNDSGVLIGGWTESHDGDVTGAYNQYSTVGWILSVSKSGALKWQKIVGDTSKFSKTLLNSVAVTLDNGFIFSGLNQTGINALALKLKGNKIITGMEERQIQAQNKELVIYPNPAQGIFTLNLSTPQSGKIEITNTLGQSIYTQTIKEESTATIDLSKQAKGVYIVELIINNEELRIYKKVVVE